MRAAYRPDGRGPADVLRQLAEVAADVRVPVDVGAGTWADLLFDGGGLRDETEASQSLLLALARLHAGLVSHFDELPAEARDWYLQQRLGIRRLRPVADCVVLVVEGDPRRLPATLQKGAVVKAGKGPRGDRLYETTEALTVLGAQVLGAHGERVLNDHDVAVRRPGEAASGPASPYPPFGAPSDPVAAHELYVASEDLRVGAGGIARLEFGQAAFADTTLSSATLRAFVGSLVWEASSPAGYLAAGGTAVSVGTGVRVSLTLPPGTGPLALAGVERTHVRGRFPVDEAAGFSRDLGFSFRFETVTLTVEGSATTPEAGFANEGVVDLTKEFEPFGPAPRRNDAFYLKSDEVFGKKLSRLSVALVGEGRGKVVWNSPSTVPVPSRDGTIPAIALTGRVVWERRSENGWAEMARGGTLVDTGLTVPSGGPASLETEVGGVRGRFVRARLDRGDFGWDRHEAELLHNAGVLARVATNASSPGSVVVVSRPAAPTLAAVRLDYATVARSSRDTDGPVVLARNGLETPREVGSLSLVTPFAQEEVAGTLTIGLGGVPHGEVVALYLDLDEAAGCDAPPDGATFVWEYLGPSGTWKPLEAVDGSLGLRMSGIVRFVAPLDWATGAPDVDETDGCWLRARSSAPQVSGRVRGIRTDAVEARYSFPAGAEGDDETPGTRLEPGQAAKLRVAVPGVKSVVNPLPSFGGAGPEPTRVFFERTSTLLRHRNRAITIWDVEQLVLQGFLEIALCRCLPHHSRDSECEPGSLAVVVVPDALERLPAPTVLLAAQIERHVRERGSPHLRVAVLCPCYVEVSVAATVHLRRGLPAGAAIREVERALRAFLHPLGLGPALAAGDAAALAELGTVRRPARRVFGRPLYRSEIVRALEDHPAVDYVENVVLDGDPEVERIDVDSCRGLVASAETHNLQPEAAL